MRIGIAAMSSRVGRGGGVDVFTRNLLDALANYESPHQLVVLVDERALDAWDYRQWPDHIQFKTIYHLLPRSLAQRGCRFLLRRLGVSGLEQEAEARQIDRMGLDLVHFPATAISLQSLATPCILTFFDLQQEYYPQFFTKAILAGRAESYRSSVDKAVRVIVPTRFTQDTLSEKYQTPTPKMSIIPVGRAPEFCRASALNIDRIKTKYQLPPSFIYYPANPWQHKNHARLIAALRIYRDRHGESPWLVLSGRLPDEHRDALSLAIAAGVEDRVIDLEYLPIADLPALYSAATVMVFPSLFEGFGIPLVEAMACGCPVVAAAATTIPEVTGDAALLFDPFDPSAIADAIHSAIHNPELRTALVANGYRQLHRFDWQDIVAQHHAVYAQAAQEARGAGC